VSDNDEKYYAAIIIGIIGVSVLLIITNINEIIEFSTSTFTWFTQICKDITKFDDIWDWVILIIVIIIFILCEAFTSD